MSLQGNSWAETIRRCEAVVMKASGPACKVFVALKKYSNSDGYCFPLIRTIMESTQIKKRDTIFKALNELESLGIVYRARLISLTGRNSPTLYRIGRPVEKLPENVRDKYALGKSRPPVLRANRGPDKRDVKVGPACDVPPDGTYAVPTKGAAPVPEERTTAVPASGTQNYSSELLEGTMAAVNHHHPHTRSKHNDDHGGPHSSQQINSEEVRVQRLKEVAFEQIKTESKGHFSEREILDFFNAVQSRASNPPSSANFFITAFHNQVGNLSESISQPSPPPNPTPSVEKLEAEWMLHLVEDLIQYVEHSSHTLTTPKLWEQAFRRWHRKAIHFINGTVEFKNPDRRREFDHYLRRIKKEKEKYESDREHRNAGRRARRRRSKLNDHA